MSFWSSWGRKKKDWFFQFLHKDLMNDDDDSSKSIAKVFFSPRFSSPNPPLQFFPPHFSIKSCGFFGQFSDVPSSGFSSFSFFLSNILRFFPKISKISLMYRLLGDKISKTFPIVFGKNNKILSNKKNTGHHRRKYLASMATTF